MSKSKTNAYVFFGICVLTRWFLKDIFSALVNLPIPPVLFPAFNIIFITIPVAFILLIGLVIYFLIEGIRKIKKQKFKAIFPFVLSLATFLFVTVFPVQECRIKMKYYSFKPIRDKIVKVVKESDVAYLDNAKVQLPWYLAYVSMDGEIYVNKNGDHVSVRFKYMQGDDFASSKYIKYSTDKQKENKYRNNDEDPIVKRLGDNWYYIEVY